MQRPEVHRTIYATYRRRSRPARIRLRHPGTSRSLISAPITVLYPALRVPGQPATYTPELAMELLNSTGELPAGKRAPHIILTEHPPPGRAQHAVADRNRPSTSQDQLPDRFQLHLIIDHALHQPIVPAPR